MHAPEWSFGERFRAVTQSRQMRLGLSMRHPGYHLATRRHPDMRRGLLRERHEGTTLRDDLDLPRQVSPHQLQAAQRAAE